MRKIAIKLFHACVPLVLGILGGMISFAMLRNNAVPPSDPIGEVDPHADDVILDREIETLDFDRMPLREVLSSFSKSQNLTIVSPQNVFGMDDVVDLHLRHVSIKRALDQIVATVDFNNHGGWAYHNGVITIAPQSDIDATGPLVERVYDVRSLIAQLRVNAARFPSTSSGFRPTSSISGPIIPGIAPPGPDAEQADKLIYLLVDHVSPESWSMNGGTGFISFLNGKLVIRQTNHVHFQIQQMLRFLLCSH